MFNMSRLFKIDFSHVHTNCTIINYRISPFSPSLIKKHPAFDGFLLGIVYKTVSKISYFAAIDCLNNNCFREKKVEVIIFLPNSLQLPTNKKWAAGKMKVVF